jgi:predicted PurR-regulated permease PerM
MALELSDRQKKTVAAAVTILAVLVILFAAAAVVWAIAVFFRTFSSVFLPIAVGGIAALVFRPYFQWLHEKAGLPRPLALVGVFLSGLVPIVAFFWFFGYIIAEQLVDLISRVPEWWNEAREYIEKQWPQVKQFFEETPTGQQIKDAVAAQGDSIAMGLRIFGEKALSAGAGVMRGVGSVLSWAVLPVYFAFFLMTGQSKVDPSQLFPFLKSETRQDVIYLINEFIDIIVAFFRGQLIVAFLQGLLYAVGFSLVGLKYGFVLGLLLGFFNIIPYLGSILGLGMALPLAFFQEGGGPGTLLAVLIVFTVVQLIESYFLTPKIMGDRTGLHFMAIIVAVFFWGTALGGIMGMLLAIPLTAFLASLWRLVKEKYMTELV